MFEPRVPLKNHPFPRIMSRNRSATLSSQTGHLSMGNVSLAPEPYEYARLKEPDRPMRLFYLEEYHENTHKNPPNSASVQDNLQEESQISGHLKHISIDDHPKYVALSYTWGSLETPFRIPVDGSYLNITANLHAVLGVLAKLPQLQGRPLWIDAICINQRNEDEKNCQVPLMGKIYSEANEVFAWIGEEAAGSSCVLDDLVTTGDYWLGIHRPFAHNRRLRIRAENLFFLSRNRGFDYSPGNRILDALEKILDPTWTPSIQTQKLFKRAWWHRVWVIQEATLAKSVSILCGIRLFSWEKVMGAIGYFSHVQRMAWKKGPFSGIPVQIPAERAGHHGSIGGRAHHQRDIRRVREESLPRIIRNRPYSLGSTLMPHEPGPTMTRSTRLMRKIGPSSRDRIHVDYSKNTRLFDILNSLTRDLFQEYGPRILAYRQPNLNEAEDLPSWYIDWTRVEQGLALFDPAQPLYIYASGNEKWCSEKRHMGNELQLPLEGITVSTVDLIANLEINPSLETSPPMGGNTSADPSPWELEDRIQDGEQVKESTSWIRPMETLLSESHEDSPARAASKLSSKQSLWVVPIAGEQDGRYPLVSDSSPGCTKEAFQTVIGERKADGASKEGIWEYWRRLKLNGNKGFVTSDGWAGLGRRTVQKEDLIVIFKGCKFPFLIRPRCEERKEYELVGACYVDGIMYGEAMEEDPTLEGMFLV
ncbi:heterokaryon incompatibility protein-domain-containing protein [Phyllosticta citrichinensis]|uniref:Heterokaryon incompatibility protein-domain-containing protein n=1 Tax=Phyllosticta citrichinensis TaxID=1130410 RepID=A0ABR1XKW5_9PEZI